MFRRLVLCLAVLALGACYYKSSDDLRRSTEQIAVTSIFPLGKHVFLTADQGNMLILDVRANGTVADFQSLGKGMNTAELIAVLRSDRFPEGVRVAMGVNIAGSPYSYFPFRFGSSHVEWFRPQGDPADISGLTQLADNIRALDAAGQSMSFELIPAERQAETIARFAAAHQR